MITVTPLCECGCGGSVNLRRGSPMRFLSGHNGRGRRKTPATLTCLNCHKTFEVRPHLASRKFCDMKCRNQFNHSHTGELNRCYKRVLVPCARCQKPASLVPNQLSRGRVPYCSEVCGKEARREKLREVGKNLAKPHCWSFGKKAAETRDEKRCRICGFSVVYHVHHIRPRSRGGNNHLFEYDYALSKPSRYGSRWLIEARLPVGHHSRSSNVH